MLDIIKPNTEWKEVAKHFGGTYKRGGVFSSTQIQVSRNNLTFSAKTSYSNDNCWSGRTIIYCTFNYKQECSVKVIKNIWTSILGKTYGVLNVSRKNKKLKQSLQKNQELIEFRENQKAFKLIFKTEGIITKDYEVLPIIELTFYRFLKKKTEFIEAFELISAVAIELVKEKIISSAPNKPL